MGMLAVLEPGAATAERQIEVLARAMGVALVPMSREPLVLDAARWLTDATVALGASPMGFDLIAVRWSPNAVVRRGDASMAAIERVAAAIVDELPLQLGYVTTYEDQLAASWIEERVLTPLLCEDWADLVHPLYHLALCAANVPAVLPPSAVTVHASSAGRVVRLGAARSPFPG